MPCDQTFRGDAASLLDRLVEASQIPVVEPWAIRERELQPWCPDADFASSPVLDGPLEARHRFPAKHGRSPDHKKSAGGAPVAAKRARAPGSPPAARRCSLDAAQGYACPSFNAAPKPEALPMPTSSLMTRALFRRSPSPMKCAMVAA
ncbi:MAG: hypothetical protein J3K34DRAFT_430657 [Monoraphidium minutum]|nr:MAG: hypothetical protein J3K34DRAFT_430657 [Monoraphidium minutum]